MTRLIERTCGDVNIAVAPELGGALACLRWRGHDILRPFDMAGEKRANLCGSYPRVPWSNRIADGRFHFAGQAWQVARNFGDHPHALHGNCWQCAWLVQENAENITLTLERPASDNWPWPWRATQVFSLTQDSLTVTLSYQNLADITVPAGLGFHPFFADASQSEVRFSAPRVWLNDDNSLPCDEVATPEKWQYPTFSAPVPASVDNCFTGWNGKAAVRWPLRGIRATLTSDAPNAVFFIPGAERNVVAIEPVSHINNAINMLPPGSDEQVMDLVAPGDVLRISMTVRMSDDE